MIRTEAISFRIGQFELRSASLQVGRGEYFVLLGPPGSGKTMFLEALCGLKRVESGRIYLGGRDVTRLEPRKRNIGYVPQDFALFPHLTVAENIAFGLRAAKANRRTVDRRVSEVADVLGIRHLAGRGISGLSGGERQRVALGRALAGQPQVLLLDEPVSALDASTREAICLELRHVQRAFNVTTIHVSHHLEEASMVADRTGVLRDGVFQQVGTLTDLLCRPASEFVARFMGCQNVFLAEVARAGPAPGTSMVRLGTAELVVPGEHKGSIQFVIRPERVRLLRSNSGLAKGESGLPVKLARVTDRGTYIRAELNGSVDLVAHLSQGEFDALGVGQGDELLAAVAVEAVHVLPT